MVEWRNFGTFFDNRANKFGSKEFMKFAGCDQAISYEEVQLKSNQIANLLINFGLKKGEVVSVLMPNQIEWPYLFIGIIKAGGIANFINYKFQEELEYVLNNSKSKILFLSSCFIKKLNLVADKLKHLQKVIVFENTNMSFSSDSIELAKAKFEKFNLYDLLNKSSSDYINNDVDRSDPAILVYTSGSTGLMKGVILTNGNILAQIELLSDTIPFGGDDIYLCQQPLFYLDYAFYFWLVMEKGGSAVIMEKFTCSNFWKIIEKYRPTFLNTVPTMLNIIMKNEEDISGIKVDSLQYISCCGEVLHPETLHKWESRFPGKIYDTYTVTEISCSGTVTPYNNRKIGSVGIPHASNQVCIMDDDLNLLGPHQIGEICTKGPCVMQGYWDNLELTNETIIDGWYHSKDLGYYDEDGYFFIVGRKNFIINKGGEKVSSVEIENVIKKIEGVGNCIVVGVPDEIVGMEIAAMIETKADLKYCDIVNYCQGKIAQFKIPKYITFTSEFPRLNTGKVDRQTIIKQFIVDN